MRSLRELNSVSLEVVDDLRVEISVSSAERVFSVDCQIFPNYQEKCYFVSTRFVQFLS